MSGITAWATWTAGGAVANAAPRAPLKGKLGAWPEAPALSKIHPRARRPHSHSKQLVQLASLLVPGRTFDNLGIAIGTSAGCALPDRDFQAELERKGIAFGGPSLFVYTLPTAPLGELSVALGARGPLVSLDSGACSALASVGVAAREVDAGRAEAMVCGVFELGPADESIALFLVEGGGRPLSGCRSGFDEAAVGSDTGLELARALSTSGPRVLAAHDALGFWAEVNLT